MRTLYNQFYKDRKRGFMDEEFREICETIAGTSLAQVFEYASTTKEVDYAKYFAYAGLDVRFASNEVAGSSMGLNTQMSDGKLVVSGRVSGSPAENAGLLESDVILTVDGVAATPKVLNDMLAARKSGDQTRLKISRAGAPLDIDITLGRNAARKYEISPLADTNGLQSTIRRDWLRLSQ